MWMDRDAGAGDRSASDVLRSEAAGAAEADEAGEAAHLGAREGGAERSDVVVAAALIVVAARGFLRGLGDQSLLDHARDRAIERAGGEPQLAVGGRLDVLNDRVSVTLPVAQRDEDVERGGWQRKQRVDLILAIHATIIHMVAILTRWQMADGRWRMADGGWRMADGGWRRERLWE